MMTNYTVCTEGSPDLNRRVIFTAQKLGYKFEHECDLDEVIDTMYHLAIPEDKCDSLLYGTSPLSVRQPVIDAYSFISSGGNPTYIPCVGETALFSDDREYWIPGKFVSYNSTVTLPYTSDIGHYRYCEEYKDGR